MTGTRLAPGANVAKLRKERGLQQAQLARLASVSVSLLSKIEVGDRTLTPATAAALGRAMGVSMAEVQGRDPVARSEEATVMDLRAAIRDYDLPRTAPPQKEELRARLTSIDELRDSVNLSVLTPLLPVALRDATSYACSANSAEGWAILADVYGAIYWLSARHRWMDLAELAVSRQRWAAEQKPNPLSAAVAARDRAGTYLNFGDCEGGLTLIDRAIAAAESALSGEERDIAVGILNLRGMTLAGRLRDDKEAKREANRHVQYARRVSEYFSSDFKVHGVTFGPRNTLAHQLATWVDLGKPRDALELTDNLGQALRGLPPTRLAPSYITKGRAQLDMGDSDGALESLASAWEIAPQLTRIHPMAQEVLRVVGSMHKRSNPLLTRLLELSGLGP
ncbi:helix-turn-helix domain-containing protein [Streptomyces litchfieldiae]|uniref:Helix-turn-helix domain-containing protein n=1 Tax=Streptomyces litchfieldiae TaxID=3075543 RepID=A0ABU2MXS3_9ACTN|nr:helix-turn-helix domain-containing protein [Streptomyces sp. DSM 44938]MDT0345354.1 helix-turn-helix domain-containing protein [Streptomyces sp. DSM 44938]